MASTGSATIQDGKTKVTYSCTQQNMSYTIIGDNIREDFKFLIKNDVNAIPGILNEALETFKTASEINDAFYFENGGSVNDLSAGFNDVKNDVVALNAQLESLYSALMKAIDNVNAELATNFGHWAFYSTHEASREES